MMTGLPSACSHPIGDIKSATKANQRFRSRMASSEVAPEDNHQA
jgi:hypothetical protein